MTKLLFLLLLIPLFNASAQDTSPKRPFITAIEIFAGPNASFNYGNKFIENYQDENVTNTRLMKIGYAAGVGLYHPISKRIDLNVRLQYETRGTKNELNVPSILNDTSRYVIFSEYTYKYLTASIIPQIYIGSKRKLAIGIGGYYSKITGVKAYDRTFSTRENIVRSEIEFEGRIFRRLRDDGTVEGTAISRGLFRMEPHDYGPVLLISYNTIIKKQLFSFQLIHYNGLKNINRNNPYGLEEKNRTFHLIITYQLTNN